MNVRRYDRDIAKAAEDFFQKITGLEPMPNRWPVYDFKGRPFMGFDGRPIQVKGSDFHQHGRYPKAGQWHWANLNDRADITVLVGFHKKEGTQCFVLTGNVVSHLQNQRDVYCGVSRFGLLSHTGQSAKIAFYRIPRKSLREYIDKLCAWMCRNKYWEEGRRQSKKSMKEFWELLKRAKNPGTEYGHHGRIKQRRFSG
jgi:hypothetical protein